MGAVTDLTGSNLGSLLGGGLPAPLLLLEELLVVIVTPILPDSFERTSAFRFVPCSFLLTIGLSSLLLLSLSTISGGARSGGGGVTLVTSAQPVKKIYYREKMFTRITSFYKNSHMSLKQESLLLSMESWAAAKCTFFLFQNSYLKTYTLYIYIAK